MVEQAWRDIVERYGALTPADYEELAGGSQTSLSTSDSASLSALKRAREEGLLGFRRGDQVFFPGFQIDRAPSRLRDGWLAAIRPLKDAGWDDEDIILWLAAPSRLLGRLSPVEVIERDGLDAIADAVTNAAAGPC